MAQYKQSLTTVAARQVVPERNQPLLHFVQAPLGQIAQFMSVHVEQMTAPVGR